MLAPPWCPPKVSRRRALIASALGVAALWSAAALGLKELPHPHYAQLIQAAQAMERALEAVSAAALARGALDPEVDINRTGFIGAYFTPVTTTPGSLHAKRTAAQPDTAAYLARELLAAGVKAGDIVLVSASASFPGLVAATLVAVESLGAEHRTVVSLGASQWGANRPEFLWPEMERALLEAGVLNQGVLLYTPGGMEDRLQGHPWERDEALRAMKAAAGDRWFVPASLAEAVAARARVLLESGDAAASVSQPPVKLLVSIGGGQATVGVCRRAIPSGRLITRPLTCEGEPGLVHQALERGIPVLHLLNVVELARRVGLVVDPVGFPALGTASVYYSRRYRPLPITSGLLAAAAGVLMLLEPPVALPSRKARGVRRGAG